MCKKLFGENKKILPQNEGKLIPEYLYSKISGRGDSPDSLKAWAPWAHGT
jgi:hypothetical protein